MSSRCLTENEVQALVAGALATARVDGVESHLDACLKCQLVVSAGARTTSLRAHGFDHEPAGLLHLKVGQVVSGRYRIARFIARGGMGEVYAAYDEMLGEEIALKILLRSASAGAAALARLRTEVQLARRVSDPHVLRVFDIGSCRLSESGGDSDGGEILFLTMQLLEGETLRARIRRAGPLPPSEVWRLAGDMFSALGAAHHLGIVHRDFKSENVMLVPNVGGPPRVVVMDFGLAQAVATDSPSNEHAAPLIAGTLGYMAPEQLSGGTVTAAADVYAFGVVLHEMLTGVLPPFRPNVGPGAPDQPPPAPWRLGALDIPARWRSLIRRCLARDPAARFRDMIDARQAIAGRSGANRRVVFRAAAAAAASLAVAASVTYWNRAPAATAALESETAPPLSLVAPPVARPSVASVRVLSADTRRSERVMTRKPHPSLARRHAVAAFVPVKSTSTVLNPVETSVPERAAASSPFIVGDEAIDPFRDFR